MTSHDWQRTKNPDAMLICLSKGTRSDRKLRLFAAACCRQIWNALRKPARDGVALVERFADGLATETERLALADQLQRMMNRGFGYEDTGVLAVSNALLTEREGSTAWDSAVLTCGMVPSPLNDREQQKAIRSQIATLLRDIFGNPFRAVAFDPA